MIAEIQVLPGPSAGNEANPYAYVEAAIGVLQKSGLHYEVGALGTTIEGDGETVWATLKAAQEAVLAAGAERVACEIKVHASAQDNGPRMDQLTSKFR